MEVRRAMIPSKHLNYNVMENAYRRHKGSKTKRVFSEYYTRSGFARGPCRNLFHGLGSLSHCRCRNYLNSEVQCGQRVALIGMTERQWGQSLVAGAGAGF